mmetsp:Transcript_21648/g.39302  ORF Transcript_21648/g.39302 Transcript_21648/m.39302 type:complete len:106 (+) Transcript_21648:624-941(+)
MSPSLFRQRQQLQVRHHAQNSPHRSPTLPMAYILPGCVGPAIRSNAGSGTKAVTIDINVTASTTPPSFWKIVSVQKSRKIEQPIVVTELPTAAPPMAFRAKSTRW